MDFSEKPVLCGGIFFSILFAAKKTVRRSVFVYGQNAGIIKEPLMFSSWIHITRDGDFNINDSVTDSTTISGYKNCDRNDVARLKFDSESFVESTKGNLANHGQVLKHIKEYCDTFLVSSMDTSVVCKRLLSLILDDDTISDNDEFYFSLGLEKTKKSSLKDSDRLYSECVLFGVWYYIVTHKLQNTSCKDSFDLLFEPHGDVGSTYDFNECGFEYNDSTPQTYISIPNFVEKPSGSGVGPKLDIVVSIDNPELNKYGWYLEEAVKYYSNVNTVLKPLVGMDFYSFYVANSVNVYGAKSKDKEEQLSRITPKNMIDMYGHFMCLVAKGGYGKSMLLKHMLLCDKRWADEYSLEKCGCIPILINIGDFRGLRPSIGDLIYKQITRFDHRFKRDTFDDDLDKGIFLFLFDGLDELSEDDATQFARQMNDFSSRHNSNYFILSSRIDDSCGMLKNFKTLQLEPFNKERAVKLINKFTDFDEATRQSFINKLNQNRYLTEIERNPLLLTIKFMVYARKNEYLGSETYRFYKSAFEVLFEVHDKIDNNMKRTYRTGLSMKQMDEALCEFCFSTFIYRWYYFTEEEIYDIVDEMETAKKYGFSADDFIYDLTSNLCLFNMADGCYEFIHRSFQEYFTARHLSRQNRSFFTEELIDIIDSCKYFKEGTQQSKKYNDQSLFHVFFDFEAFWPVMDMLRDMSEKRLWCGILLPRMKWAVPSENDAMAVLKYVERNYHFLEWTTGDVPEGEDAAPICPLEIMNYIKERILEMGENAYHVDFMPDVGDKRFITDEYILGGWDEETHMPIMINTNDVDMSELEPDECPPIRGRKYKVDTEDLIKNPQGNEPMTSAILEEFRDEYDALYKLMKKYEGIYK